MSSNKTSNTYYYWFPRTYNDDNSLFGGCLCGVANTDGIPCNHMCVVVKSCRIEGLNETNIMPIWWHTSHWRRQYPADSVVWSTVGIESLRNAALQKLTTWTSSFVHHIQQGGRVEGHGKRSESRGAIEIAIDKTEKKKKMAETWKKREPIEPDDPVEYRTIKKKREKETVAKEAKGKGKVAKGNGGERKRGYKKRVTQPTTTSPKKKKARRGK